MGLTVLVAGASGFVGSRLTPALLAAGHRVRGMTRYPDRYTGAGEPVAGDVSDPASLGAALHGVDVAYYLVHSLGEVDFEQRDADAARLFASAAAVAGLSQIVYLGGLGRDRDRLSPHLRSRREVERLLGLGGVPVTGLRAAVIVGHGSASWEITRRLAETLPMLLQPAWADTLTQPIALVDVVRYLVGVLGVAKARGRAFDIGGPDVLGYLDMLQIAAEMLGRRVARVPLPLPLSGPLSRFTAGVLGPLAGIDAQTARNLLESITTEVVVRDLAIQEVVPGPTLDYRAAVELALADRAAALGAESPSAGPAPDVPPSAS